MKNIIFKQSNALIIFRIGKTSNKKIALPNETIVQTYSFSHEQFEIAKGKTNMKEFFSADGSVCMDCPFAVSNGAKLSACYTHKLMQYSGFLSMLRGIHKTYLNWDSIPELNEEIFTKLVDVCANKYVRFGTYGEPSLIPVDLVKSIVEVSKSHTGYTHQWAKKPEFAEYFMASVHNAFGENIARKMGYRSFVATKESYKEFTQCPASNEAGFKSNCSKCGLCSGNRKGSKSIVILEH
jgi:hypothetical protein